MDVGVSRPRAERTPSVCGRRRPLSVSLGDISPHSVLCPQAYRPACSDSRTSGPRGCLGMGCRARPLEVMEVILATCLSTGHTCPRSWPRLPGALLCSHQAFPMAVPWAGSCSGSVHMSKQEESVTS